MKKARKSIGIGISAILLFCFSVTILPLDLLHNHPLSFQVSCKEKDGQPCKHKLHMATKNDFCFVCAIHFDKVFDSPKAQKHTIFTPSVSFLLENKVSSFFVELIFTSLRGPPSSE